MAGIATGWVTIPVELLDKAPWNVKDEDEAQSKALAANMARNGVIVNSIVRALPNGRYELVDGNHRLDAYESVGVEEVMCFNLGDKTEPEAQRIAIEINETRFPTNEVRLAQAMEVLSVEFGLDDLEATMPYTRQDLEDLVEMTRFDWENYGESRSESAFTDKHGAHKDETGVPMYLVRAYLPAALHELWQQWIDHARENLDALDEQEAFVEAVRALADHYGFQTEADGEREEHE